MNLLAQGLTDTQQYGLAGIFLVGFVVVGKLMLNAYHKTIEARESQIADLKAEKERLVKRLEMINDTLGKRKKNE